MPDEIVENGTFDGNYSRHPDRPSQTAPEDSESHELDSNTDNPDSIEPQPCGPAGLHGRRSSLYSRFVFLMDDAIAMASNTTMATTPLTSPKR